MCIDSILELNHIQTIKCTLYNVRECDVIWSKWIECKKRHKHTTQILKRRSHADTMPLAKCAVKLQFQRSCPYKWFMIRCTLFSSPSSHLVGLYCFCWSRLNDYILMFFSRLSFFLLLTHLTEPRRTYFTVFVSVNRWWSTFIVLASVIYWAIERWQRSRRLRQIRNDRNQKRRHSIHNEMEKKKEPASVCLRVCASFVSLSSSSSSLLCVFVCVLLSLPCCHLWLPCICVNEKE